MFVPGVTDPGTIATLAKAVPAPVNVMAGPGAPSVPELAELGVARVSLGSAVVRRATEEALSAGTYTTLNASFDFATLNALMRPTP